MYPLAWACSAPFAPSVNSKDLPIGRWRIGVGAIIEHIGDAAGNHDGSSLADAKRLRAVLVDGQLAIRDVVGIGKDRVAGCWSSAEGEEEIRRKREVDRVRGDREVGERRTAGRGDLGIEDIAQVARSWSRLKKR